MKCSCGRHVQSAVMVTEPPKPSPGGKAFSHVGLGWAWTPTTSSRASKTTLLLSALITFAAYANTSCRGAAVPLEGTSKPSHKQNIGQAAR
jgi:hypothetical protein